MKLETDELTAALDRALNYVQGRGQILTIEEITAIAQAISLKRIADVLERFQTKLEAEEAEEKKQRGG